MIDMIRQAQKVRIYPTNDQKQQLAKAMGCCRWWWNYALNVSIETYTETGKSISRSGLNALLPNLKLQHQWLKSDVYSQSLQQTTLNLSRAFINFFEKRAKYPRFKSKHGKQSVGFPQSVQVQDDYIKLPKIGRVKAVFDRRYEGKIKTVTVTQDRTDKYFASITYELEACLISPKITDPIIGIDLGLKDFAITNDGQKTRKYNHPKCFAKHQKNLARKQQKLSRKQKGSNSRKKARKLVAKVHARISNARQDFLQKLSRKLTNENQVVVVENPSVHLNSIQVLADGRIPRLNVKGMVRNPKLAKAIISDVGWGMFVNFLSYKLEREDKKLIEIDRWFPSSKTCSNCHYQIDKLPLDIRMWTCPNCGKNHDRDQNAAINIRAEGIRMLKADGIAASAGGGDVRPTLGRKTMTRQSPVKPETTYLA